MNKLMSVLRRLGISDASAFLVSEEGKRMRLTRKQIYINRATVNAQLTALRLL